MPSTKEGGKYAGSRYKLNSDNCCITFLGVLIVLQQLLKNNKFSFQSHLNKKKRIRFIDEFGLSNSERIRLIRVDDKEYLYFSSKGSSPTVIPS